MLSVNIDDKLISKIIETSKETKDERLIGLLIGKVKDNKIIIGDAIQTRHLKDKHGIKIHPNDLAQIANKILEKKLEGNVIGWFHTHPGYGAFMSDIDVQTQKTLHQFSPFIVSLIVDPKKKEVKFFTLNEDKKVKEVRGENMSHLDKRNKPSMLSNRAAPPSRYPTAPPKQPLTRKQIYIIVTTVVLIGVLLASIFLYFFIAGIIAVPPAYTSPPSIKHVPVEKGEVGREITIKATVIDEGPGINNVTLSYEWTEWTTNNEASESVVEHPWKTQLMLLIAPEGDEYAYTIPSNEVAGNIDYFISAYDKAGSSVGTPIHTIQVSDFQIEAETDTIIVHLGEEKSIDVFIRSINDFQSPVELRTEKTPYGIQASINPSKVTPPKGGESKVTFKILASDAPGTFRGQFDLLLYGKSGNTEHKALIEQIVIPYYEVSVSPTSVTIDKDQTASYNIKITPSQDFSKEISFSISGLPSEEISWEINLKNKKIAVASETDLILKISTTKKTETGTYNLTLNIEGGGLKNQIALSLTIK